MEFKCSLCNAEFYKKPYLRAHLSRTHSIKNENKNAQSNIVCLYCKKHFPSKRSLATHVRKIHEIVKATVVCQEENCEKRFQSVCELRTHLSTSHELKDIENCEKLNFEKYSDFQQWLAGEEKNSSVKFVIQTKKKNESYVYISFWCNRSGVYKPKVVSRKRQLKAQGTMKIGFHCTAAIVVKDFYSHVEVIYYTKHYKHKRQLCHLPLPQVEKKLIADKLLLGIGEKDILQDIHQSSSTSFERKHLITKKDLQNIKRDFGLMLPNSRSVIENDEMSVCTSVQNERNNPVLLYKKQDDLHPTTQDFMLILLTNFKNSNFDGPLNKSISSVSINSESSISESDQLESNKIEMGVIYNKLNSLTTMSGIVSKQIKNHIAAIKHLLGIQAEPSFPSRSELISEQLNRKVIKRFYSGNKSHSNKKN